MDNNTATISSALVADLSDSSHAVFLQFWDCRPSAATPTWESVLSSLLVPVPADCRPVLPHHPSSCEFISKIPVEGYDLLQPIPVSAEKVDNNLWIARFEAANLGMSGETREEAVNALAHNIVDTLEFYSEEEERLIPKLKEYFDVLLRYVGKMG